MCTSNKIINNHLLLRLLVTTLLSILTTNFTVADCRTAVINNFVDIDPSPASIYENANIIFYPLTNGQSYDFTDTNNRKNNFIYTITSPIEPMYAVDWLQYGIKVIPFYRTSVNGVGGSAPQGTSETLEIFFNSGSKIDVNFIISDLDHYEGIRVVGYLGSTTVTPTISNLNVHQTLSTLPSGEAQWFSDDTSTTGSENTVSFDQPINKLVITSYKPINGSIGTSGGFNLHELNATLCDTPAAVPTLSEWALIMLMIMLSVVGYGMNFSYSKRN